VIFGNYTLTVFSIKIVFRNKLMMLSISTLLSHRRKPERPMKRYIFILTLMGLLCVATQASASNINLNDRPSSIEAANADFHLSIPSVNIDLSVVNAPYRSTTWDFSQIISTAGHLEGLPVPGQGSNVVIGAHSELSQRQPGPFFHLEHVGINDLITVNYEGHVYVYQVVSKREVSPLRTDVLSSTQDETLTLMTCSGYQNGNYTKRLVVQARLVEKN
jgi:LPXTG-site transpeptidase (sortase) family protein